MTDVVRGSFDYGSLDVETRNTVRKMTGEFNGIALGTAQNAWKMGEILSNVQRKLAKAGSGTFVAWLESETPASRSSAYRYMNLYKSFDFPTVGKMAAKPLYALSEASVPEPVRQEAIARADAGENITYPKAKEIISHNRPTSPAKTPKPERRGREWTEGKIRQINREYQFPDRVLSYAEDERIQVNLPPLNLMNTIAICDAIQGLKLFRRTRGH